MTHDKNQKPEAPETPRSETATHESATGDDSILTPAEVERERALVRPSPVTLDTIAAQSPERAIQIVQNRIKALRAIRVAALSATRGVDWTANKPDDATPEDSVLTLRKSGAENVRKYYGVSVHVRGEPRIVEENGKRFAEVVGDAVCGLTGETSEMVVGRRGEKERFVGRDQEMVGLGDLRQAARTCLETKCVRILAGMSAVTPAELAEAWGCEIQDVVARVNRGHGFGTSNERRAERSAAKGGDAVPAENGQATVEQMRLLWAAAVDREKQTGAKAPVICRDVFVLHGVQPGDRVLSTRVPASKFDAVLADVRGYGLQS